MKKKWKEYFPCKGKYGKIFRIMKLCMCVLFCSVMSLSASVRAQQMKVSIEMRGATLEEIIWTLEKKSEITFFYNVADVAGIRGLDAVFKDTSLEEILGKVLEGTGLYYQMNDKVVVVKRLIESKTDSLTNARVTGYVKDEGGLPLPGVSVLLKGTTVGVSTDKNGKFVLMVPDLSKATIVVSFIGMKTQTLSCLRFKEMNPWVIVMEEDAQEMEEVVVTGYQRIDKRLSASSTYTVKAADIMKSGMNSIDDMLQGEIPGLMIVNTSGSPSALPKIRMRGTATLLGNAAPVWVIDGVIREDPVNITNEDVAAAMEMTNPNYLMFGNAISGLNPMDIESITFLKDASATAIYGTRAANGVIVVTTKKGRSGRTAVNYSGTYTVKQRPSYRKSADVMNSQERMKLSKEFFEDGLILASTPRYGYEKAMLDYLENRIPFSDVEQEYSRRVVMNTDWFDVLFSNAFSHSHSLSISGGKDRISYYISASFASDKGTANGDDVKRYTLNSRVELPVFKWLDADFKMEYSNRQVSSFYDVNPMNYALRTARTLAADERYVRSTNYVSQEIKEGQYQGVHKFTYDLTYNVLDELRESGSEGENQSFSTALSLRANILAGLKGDVLVSYSATRGLTEKWATDRSYYMANLRGYDYGSVEPGSINEKLSMYPYGGRYERDEENSDLWMVNARLNYMKTWDDVHSLNVMVGGEMTSHKQTGFETAEYGYFPDRGKVIYYEYNQADAGNLYDFYGTSASKHPVSLTDQINNKMSLLATLAYSYKNRYILNTNFRVDASSRFGKKTNNRFLPIWSIAARWNVVSERWMEKQKWFNDLSLKVSYGLQGNVISTVGPDLIAKYPLKPIDEYIGEYVLNLKSLPYPDLRWEKTQTVNLGLEFSMFDSRFSGSVEYYQKRGKELLYTLNVPVEQGVDAAYQNGANIRNEGIDVSLTFVPLKTQNFRWTLSPVLSWNRDKIRRKTENRSYGEYLSGTVVLNDYAVSSFWSWKYKGLTHEDGFPVFEYDSGNGYTNTEMKEDPTKFLEYSGRRNPVVTGGLSTRFVFYNFTLRASFAYNLGAKIRLRPVYDSRMALDAPSHYENVPAEFVTHWRKPGDEEFTDNPGFLKPGRTYMYVHPAGTESMYTMWDEGNHRVVSGDFLRCRSIGLNYSFPKSVASRLGLNGLTMELSGNDLFVIANKRLRNQDPETSSSAVPRQPSYNFTINISL